MVLLSLCSVLSLRYMKQKKLNMIERVAVLEH
jgi:hypothetical protein